VTSTPISTADAPQAIGTYSQAVRAGNTVYLSGQIPLDPKTGELVAGDMEAQVRRVFDNLRAVAEARGLYVADLTVAILDRPRHEKIIEEVRRAGARVKLLQDGDVAAAMATTNPEAGIDILMGTGGSQQGILTAAALRCARER